MVYFCRYLRPMQVDVLIVGQGISGTMLSWFLYKEGKSFLVLDDAAENAASNVAAGVINPVTGRRFLTTWMAEELLAFSKVAYTGIQTYLNNTFFYPKSIIDFFPSPQMRDAFVDRMRENDTYMHAFPDQNLFNPFFQYEAGCGEIKPAYTVHLQGLLTAWQKKLQELQALRQESFMLEELQATPENIRYRDITAEKIVFCNGIAAAGNPWFSRLPFSLNKGESLVIACKKLPRDHIFKKGMMLVPLPQDDLFWLGSNYQWDFEDAAPSETFYKAAKALLQQWLKKPYEIVAHKAAVRPATVERRPFVGFHPLMPSIGILNGLGTKGTSLAPFFAHQLVQHLVHGLPLAPEADVRRFSRILTR